MQFVHFSEDFLDPISGSAASKGTYIQQIFSPSHLQNSNKDKTSKSRDTIAGIIQHSVPVLSAAVYF